MAYCHSVGNAGLALRSEKRTDRHLFDGHPLDGVLTAIRLGCRGPTILHFVAVVAKYLLLLIGQIGLPPLSRPE